MELDRISLDYLINSLDHPKPSVPLSLAQSKHDDLAKHIISNIPAGAISTKGGILVLCPNTWTLRETLYTLQSFQDERGNGDIMCTLLPLTIYSLNQAQTPTKSQSQANRRDSSININNYEEIVLLFKGNNTPELLQRVVNRCIIHKVVNSGQAHKLTHHFEKHDQHNWLKLLRTKGRTNPEVGVRFYIEARTSVATKELLSVFSKEVGNEVGEGAETEPILRSLLGEDLGFYRREAVLKEVQRTFHKVLAKGLVQRLCEDIVCISKEVELNKEEAELLRVLKSASAKEDSRQFSSALRKLSRSFKRFEAGKYVWDALLHLFPAAVGFAFVIQRLDRPGLFPAFCTLAGTLNKLNVLKAPGEVDQVFEAGLTILPAHKPVHVLTLVSAFVPAYQRIGRLKDMPMIAPQSQTKVVLEPHADYKIALFGGGPSSLLPMVASSLSSAKVRFFGVPSESYVVRGRDPQKTLATMLQVAQRYKTYGSLEEQTALYYRYIASLMSCYGYSAEEAADLVYNIAGPVRPMDYEGDVLLYCEAHNDFVPVKLTREGRLYLETKKGKTLRVYKSTDKVFKYEDGFEVDIEEAVTVSIPDAAAKTDRLLVFAKGLHFFRYLPRLHGDLHYLTLFSNAWEAPVSFREARSMFQHVVNRASFEYPTNSVADTMTALNYDYIEAVASCLARAQKPLSELEQRFEELLTDYLEGAAVKRRKCLSSDRFILFGCGRASGEMARRLAYDELRFFKNKAVCGMPMALYNSVDSSIIVAEEDKLRGILRARKKFVVAVDHKRVDFDEKNATEKLHELNNSVSYRDFLFEVTRGSFIPTLKGKDLDYYKELLKHLNKDGFAGNRRLIEYLRRLCSQERAVSNFVLRTHNTRKVEVNSVEMSHLLGLNPAESSEVDDWIVLRVGGAKQVGEPLSKAYDFLRINDSHFRQENLAFLKTFMPPGSSSYASMEDILVLGEASA